MSANTEPVISFEDVYLDFGEGDVLQGLSFQVKQGETKVLVGESGAGKTLALKLAAGLLRPTRGHIRVLGRDVTAMRERELLAFRREMGFVFQEGALFDSLTVKENVGYRLNEDRLEEEEVSRRVCEALQFVELENTEALLPGDMSGGMRRRVAIARAVVSNPPLVLYDSPTAGLDPITSQTIITLILRLRDTQGITSVLVTHRLQDAFGLANYRFSSSNNSIAKLRPGANGNGSDPVTTFVVLREGKVYFEGEPQAVLNSSDAYLKGFLF